MKITLSVLYKIGSKISPYVRSYKTQTIYSISIPYPHANTHLNHHHKLTHPTSSTTTTLTHPTHAAQ